MPKQHETISAAEEARFERLADYAESDAVVKYFKNGRPGPGFRGRPSLSGAKEHSPKVQARVPQPLYDKLNRRAQATGTTVSEVLREAIEKL